MTTATLFFILSRQQQKPLSLPFSKYDLNTLTDMS